MFCCSSRVLMFQIDLRGDILSDVFDIVVLRILKTTEYSHTIVAWWLSGIRRGYFYGYCEGLVSK